MHNPRRNRQENLAKIEIRTLALLQEKGPCTGNIGIYEFLTEGAPNPPDLEGIEEDQLLQIQQKIQETKR